LTRHIPDLIYILLEKQFTRKVSQHIFLVKNQVPFMKNQQPNQSASAINLGVLLGIAAFLLWGLSPIYWKEIRSVPALEIILHRVVWSFVVLLPIVIITGRWTDLVAALKHKRNLAILAVTSIFVSANWLTYVWAVNNNYLLQASLGYYINPLVNVLLGMVFLKERLRRFQWLAVILAAIGVLYLTIYYGEFPWISLLLGFSFGFYGLIRKIVQVGSLIGLTIETLLLAFPSAFYLIFLYTHDQGSFLQLGAKTDLMLFSAGVITVVPLLFFTVSARRLNLSTVGFMQYIAPTCIFILGVLIYEEPFYTAHVITFLLIWTALVLYSIDSVINLRGTS